MNTKNPIRFGLSIIVLGALFKIMHWPGANLIFMIGCITTSIIQLVKFLRIKTKLPRDYMVSTFIIAFVTYYMMKVLHWPWSIIPLTIACLAMLTALIYQMINPSKDVLQTKSANNKASLIFLIAGALTILGAVFKIMHLPLANPFLIAGLGIFAFFLVFDLFSKQKKSQT